MSKKYKLTPLLIPEGTHDGAQATYLGLLLFIVHASPRSHVPLYSNKFVSA